ncbi:MAG TPA: porin family protein [Puia sp.]
MKTILLFTFVMAMVNATTAQIQYGVKAGLNRVSLNYSGSAINDLGVRYDFNAGIFASVPLFSNFYLQPELMYSGQGSGFTDSIPADANYNYLNVPVLFKYQHTSGFFAETGPQIDFLLSAELKSDGHSIDNKNYTQSTDFSWVLGIGYKISSINTGIDMRYNFGLTNTIKASSAAGTAKNSVFQLDLFYQFKNL